MKRIDWREVLACLPLPMLALAAAYGVYSYALLFVPPWVAVAQAAAYEGTYIGLAVVRVKGDQRSRARMISLGAVLASIIYNSLAGWFYRSPELLSQASLVSWLTLAILHGAPLAWVAFLVSDLLLHREPSMVHPDQPEAQPEPLAVQQQVQVNLLCAESEPLEPLDHARRLKAQGHSLRQIERDTGVPYSTLRRKLQ